MDSALYVMLLMHRNLFLDVGSLATAAAAGPQEMEGSLETVLVCSQGISYFLQHWCI
jgi:hypothetical protein